MATKKTATDGRKNVLEQEKQKREELARSTAFSTRLLPAQRALIEDAATLKGCTASTLIRDAAVKYAANIMNIRNEKKPGLLALFAARVGRQLVDTRLDYLDEHGKPVPRHLPSPDDELSLGPSEKLELKIYGENHEHKAVKELILFAEGGFDGDPEADDDGARSVVSERFADDDLVLLERAVQLGGAEFMRLVIESCWTLKSKSHAVRPSLANQDYIDPGSMETLPLGVVLHPANDGELGDPEISSAYIDDQYAVESIEEDDQEIFRDIGGDLSADEEIRLRRLYEAS
jgi:uncharacterized protein (DUF1778 family)